MTPSALSTALATMTAWSGGLASDEEAAHAWAALVFGGHAINPPELTRENWSRYVTNYDPPIPTQDIPQRTRGAVRRIEEKIENAVGDLGDWVLPLAVAAGLWFWARQRDRDRDRD